MDYIPSAFLAGAANDGTVFHPPLRDPVRAAVPPVDEFAHPTLSPNESRLLRTLLTDTFPVGAFALRYKDGEYFATLTLDSEVREFRARSIPQLAVLIHDYNLARGLRAAKEAA